MWSHDRENLRLGQWLSTMASDDNVFCISES